MAVRSADDLQASIKQQLENNDDIEDISRALSTLFDVKISPVFCSSLFLPIFQHAVENEQLVESVDTYVLIFTGLYKYLLKTEQVCARHSFVKCVGLIADLVKAVEFENNDCSKYPFAIDELELETLLFVLSIAIRTCNEMIVINIEAGETNHNVYILWEHLPCLLNCCITHFDIMGPMITIVTTIIHNLIQIGFIESYPMQVESLLSCLLHLLQNHNNDTAVATAISSIIQNHPDIKLRNPSEIATFTNAIAIYVHPDNLDHARAVLNVSCLLLRNYYKTPWLDDILTIDFADQLGILKKKTGLLLQYCQDLDNSQVEHMDIDSPVNHKDLDFSSILDCSVVYKELTRKTSSIVDTLVAEETIHQDRLMLIDKLKELAIQTGNMDMISLCKNQMKDIVRFVVLALEFDPEMFIEIAAMFEYEPAQFILKYLEYALPYSIFNTNDNNALLHISSLIDVPFKAIFEEYAHYIILALLLEPDATKRNQSLARLQVVSGKPQIYKHLATVKATKITTTLALNLGKPELKKQSLLALNEMKNIVCSTPMSLPQYLSQYFVSILTNISRLISEWRLKGVTSREPYAIKGLNESMIAMGAGVSEYALHLVKVFETVSEIEDYQSEALGLWQTFIGVLDDGAFSFNFQNIMNGILKLLPLSTTQVRSMVAILIQSVLEREIELNSPSFSDMPDLPDYKELHTVRQMLKDRLSKNTDLQSEITTIIRKLDSPDDIQILSELKKLDNILRGNPAIKSGLLVSKLLYLVQKYASNKEISRLVGVCFGKIGAIDPSLLDVKTIEDEVFVMRNFADDNENRAFICRLITDHIFPAYGAIRDENVRLYFHLSVQSLLQCAGFSDTGKMANKTSATYLAWSNLPASAREFLTPFLNSSFTRSRHDESSGYPIFTVAQSFPEWVLKWYSCLVQETSAKAKDIFEACLPIVISGATDVTMSLLPYLVLYCIFSGSGDATSNIIKEMLLVLDTNAELRNDSIRGHMNQQCLQVTVAITEYCRKWLNNIKLGDRGNESQARRVAVFLARIPDDVMAIAAFYSKAYPQSLMHFETYCKRNPEPLSPEILNYLRQIYTRLEDRIDLIALLKENAGVLKYDKDLVLFESQEGWKDAEVVYDIRISDNPDDIALYTECMDSLKKWGNYGKIAEINMPAWAAQINSRRIDSAWRVNNYHVLDKAVAMSTERTPEALVGCVLSKMRNKKNLEAASIIETSRDMLVEQLSSIASKSYRKSYPIVFNLQLVQELETAQAAWDSDNPTDSIKKLEGFWNHNYENIASNYQYKHDLLELRKAAFFDIRPKSDAQAMESKLWLQLAKSSRKAGNLGYSLKALLKAEKISNMTYMNERAKWYWVSGYKEEAMNLLLSKPGKDVTNADAILASKFYTQDPSMGDHVEIKVYFRKAFGNCENYVSYIINATAKKGSTTSTLFNIVRGSYKALSLGSKYYYSNMSRLINGWFELAVIYDKAPDKVSTESNPPVVYFNQANIIMGKITQFVRPYQFCLFLTRLIAHLSCKNEEMAQCLMKIIHTVFVAYPSSTVWLLLGVEKSKNILQRKRMTKILDMAQTSPQLSLIIRQTRELVDALKLLADYRIETKSAMNLDMRQIRTLFKLSRLQDLRIYIPTEASLYPNLPEVNSKETANIQVFPKNLPYIKKIQPVFMVMRSLQKPKRITIEGSDGKQYKFLVKSEDELQKDARTMEFNYAINSFLKRDTKLRDHELYIRTYAVIPLGEKWGLIQWIDCITPLKTIIDNIWVSEGRHSVGAMSARFKDMGNGLPSETARAFKNVILPQCPAVFHQWFLRCFPEPNQWLASRTRYTKTLAVMSIVGYMVGLGDRHAENILFDETNGDCVHVDLNMLFDLGLGLTIPEVVPFRLTKNLIDAMGVLGYNGLFTTTCEQTMDVLLRNKDALMSVFQTLGTCWSLEENVRLESEGGSSTRIDSIQSRNEIAKRNNEIRQKKTFDEKFELQPGRDADRRVKELIEKASNPDNLAKMFAGKD
ncbi:hypothetical protein HPULCUR_009935 [Helicostylum pulchrum]|uniref:Serine/threonine-protein kinase ATR n=1 Tax=Helicostylum pulchrum TaxID=562976 RepID=A0ABP9YDT0_9FUNG